jgi:uncharacterized damage-inducible protein DinB
MSLNPYAGDLGANDPVEVVASTPEKLNALLSKLTDEQIERRPAPGKWNLREVVAHLADCEIAFGFRLRQGVAGVDIQPFDQDDWARNYGAYSTAAALATFTTLRAWNVALIHSLSEHQRARTVTHPERGPMTVWTIVETMGGHDLHHLRSIEKLVR